MIPKLLECASEMGTVKEKQVLDMGTKSCGHVESEVLTRHPSRDVKLELIERSRRELSMNTQTVFKAVGFGRATYKVEVEKTRGLSIDASRPA